MLEWGGGGGGGFLISLPPTWLFANRRPVYGELLDESLAAPTAFFIPTFEFRVNV